MKLREKYKIINLQDIGHDEKNMETALVLEELRSRLIRFLRIDYTDGTDPKTGEQVGKRLVLS